MSHRRLALTLLILTALLAAPGQALAVRPMPPQPIYGGDNAAPGDFPFMVALVAKSAPTAYDGQFCGGTLIEAEWVLTAAHCVDGVSPGAIYVLIGRNRLNGSGGQKRGVSQITIHPDYVDTPTYVAYDVALLKLKTASSQPQVHLASQSQLGLWGSGDDVTILGWGEVENGTYPDILQRASVTVRSDASCSSFWIIDPALHVCAGGISRAVCFGDSGGPMLIFASGSWRQVGVVSYGTDPCQSGVPDVYSQVGTYPLKYWIQQHAT